MLLKTLTVTDSSGMAEKMNSKTDVSAMLSLQLGRQLSRLLCRISCDEIHQGWRQNIVRLQPHILQLRANVVHVLGIMARLDDGGNKRGELWFLPSFLVGQFGVDEIKALERVGVDDTTEHVHAAFLAGVALDRGRFVDDLQLLAVRGDLDVVLGYHSHHREEGAFWSPTLAAATQVRM